MNGFLEKTRQSLTAAQVLLDKSLYANSVHCSFYGCLQTILHVLFVKLKRDKDKFEVDLKFKKTGTHQHAFELIQKEIKRSMHLIFNGLKRVLNT